MAITEIEADYLVIGSGAVSMAFVDTLLSESPDASFVMVDRHHLPGGHWNDAYPFVRLHQPSALYGVASTELGSNRIDAAGPNQGFYELASGAEVSAYFEKVMRERFLPSGRVQYFPMCDYLGDGQFRSLLSPSTYRVSVRRKTVDGTFFNTSVPSTHRRQFVVDDERTCVAPNELPRRAAEFGHYTVLGGGKTGMDAIVWLLDAGAEPGSITWVCPRDSWLVNRATVQPGSEFMAQSLGAFAAQLEAITAATSVSELFERLEAAAVMLRVDPSVEPTMFHYATLSSGELDQLRRVRNVIREGRVAHVGTKQLRMENGASISANPDSLYVDCTATAVQFTGSKSVPVFAGDRITLQAIRAPLVTVSAALIGFVEANYTTDDEKNRLCTPVELADTPAEWMASFLGNLMNQGAWSQEPRVAEWLANCRLDPSTAPDDPVFEGDSAAGAVRSRMGQLIGPAVQNLQRLLAAENPPAG